MIKIFTLVGFLVTICVLCILAYILFCFITNTISELVGKYKIKHRFDKPPTAKCYCRDCVHWDACNLNCYEQHAARGFSMADSCFCCFAEPIGSERFEKREEIIKDTKKSQG